MRGENLSFIPLTVLMYVLQKKEYVVATGSLIYLLTTKWNWEYSATYDYIRAYLAFEFTHLASTCFCTHCSPKVITSQIGWETGKSMGFFAVADSTAPQASVLPHLCLWAPNLGILPLVQLPPTCPLFSLEIDTPPPRPPSTLSLFLSSPIYTSYISID